MRPWICRTCDQFLHRALRSFLSASIHPSSIFSPFFTPSSTRPSSPTASLRSQRSLCHHGRVHPLASSFTLQGSPALSISPSDETVESTNLYPRNEEGERILRGHDFSAILLLLRFWPYPDESLLRSVLRNRRVSVLATLLVLAGIDNRQAIAGLSKDQMLDRLKSPYHINSPTWHPIFGPRQTVDQTPDGLAAIVNQQSWRRFYQIPFAVYAWSFRNFGGRFPSLPHPCITDSGVFMSAYVSPPVTKIPFSYSCKLISTSLGHCWLH